MPNAPKPPAKRVQSNDGCLIGCVAQLALFFLANALVGWLSRDRPSMAPLGGSAVLAVVFLAAWLLPLLSAPRISRNFASSETEAGVSRLGAWAMLSAAIAVLGFLLLSISV